MTTREPPKTTLHVLLEVARLTGRRLRARFEGTGLHRGQAFLLMRLLHGDGIPQSELARDVHRRAPTVTRMLARMESAGWVVRRPDPADHRISRVYLTAQARALRAEIGRSMKEHERELLADLTSVERETFHRLLVRVHERALELQAVDPVLPPAQERTP